MFYLKKHSLLVKKIPLLKNREIFLTFDDGPDPESTSKILDILAQEKWPATFFVIGHRAQTHLPLIQRMLQDGHSVFSHSLDHNYFHYFKGKAHLKNWLEDSIQDLGRLTGQASAGFRPPAGILTPPLLQAAEEMNVPLVLWNHRFFDSVYQLTEKKVLKNISQLSSGDIVLLHDRQPQKRQAQFASSLSHYIRAMKAKSFAGCALTNELIFQAVRSS